MNIDTEKSIISDYCNHKVTCAPSLKQGKFLKNEQYFHVRPVFFNKFYMTESNFQFCAFYVFSSLNSGQSWMDQHVLCDFFRVKRMMTADIGQDDWSDFFVTAENLPNKQPKFERPMSIILPSFDSQFWSMLQLSYLKLRCD